MRIDGGHQAPALLMRPPTVRGSDAGKQGVGRCQARQRQAQRQRKAACRGKADANARKAARPDGYGQQMKVRRTKAGIGKRRLDHWRECCGMTALHLLRVAREEKPDISPVGHGDGHAAGRTGAVEGQNFERAHEAARPGRNAFGHWHRRDNAGKLVLMDIVPIAPPEFDVEVALAYATAANITGQPVYRNARCWLRRTAAQHLQRAIELAAPLGLRLRIFDALRPTEAQWVLWNARPDPEFLADPRRFPLVADSDLPEPMM
jgi:hypothetical protein